MSDQIHLNYFIFLLVVICAIHTGAIKKNFNSPFTNVIAVNSVQCIEHDATFARFAYCYLKPINRTTKLLSLRVLLLKPPVTKSNVQFTIYKRANGYKPFVINVTLDICQYLEGKKNRVFDWFYSALVKYSNMNHTCPYADDMVLEKMPVNSIVLPSLFPDGDYRLDLMVDAFAIPRATVKIFLTIKEK